MRIPLSWLKDYVDIDGVSVEALKNGLFSCGFEVEEVIEVNKNVNKIVTCKVLQKVQHPAADKLFVCQVDAGEYGVLQIVTNAKNVSEGDIVPVAVNGATLADGTVIKNGKLRGVESFGMFCGGEEIGISDEYYDGASGDSVLIFHDDFELGKEVADLLDIKDVVFDISVTANRPDCQSVLGIAREVSAMLLRPLKMPDLSYETESVKTEEKVSVSVLDNELCPRYMGTYCYDVKIASSPKWMQKRLYLMGIRAINNVVDVTNYVLNEIGQPMHAFDYREIEGKSLVIRRAKEGEKIVTLDDKEFTLNGDVLVICDQNKPCALAGIMGGKGSGIKDDTSEIVFEAAMFKRDNIRKNSKKLNQRSDSSARFEKGVDAYTTEIGMKRALSLMSSLKIAKIAQTTVDVNANDMQRKTIVTDVSKINKLLGIVVPNDEIVKILNSLNFDCVLSDSKLTVSVPLYREDVEDYPDLAEEVIRMYGYDHINCTLLKDSEITHGGRDFLQTKEQQAKEYLKYNGFNEIVTYSFVSPKDYQNFDIDTSKLNLIKLKNPLGEDLSIMRTTLLPSVVSACVRNLSRKNLQARLYEIAKVYLADELPLEKLPHERTTLCMAVFGENEDFFTLKGAFEGLLTALGYSKKLRISPSQKPFLHPTRCASYYDENGEEVCYLGQISPVTCEKLGADKPIYVAEANYEKLSENFDKQIFVKAFSKFPSVERDLALVCDKTVTNGAILEAIDSARIKNLINVELFDVYTGDRILSDKKSMAYRLTFSSVEKTLEVDEVDNYVRKILAKLEQIGVKLR